jgi:hypothetical protein
MLALAMCALGVHTIRRESIALVQSIDCDFSFDLVLQVLSSDKFMIYGFGIYKKRGSEPHDS